MVRSYQIRICDECINLEGEMCHNSACVFCRRTMAEVGDALDMLLIRPVIDGARMAPMGAVEDPATVREGGR